LPETTVEYYIEYVNRLDSFETVQKGKLIPKFKNELIVLNRIRTLVCKLVHVGVQAIFSPTDSLPKSLVYFIISYSSNWDFFTTEGRWRE